MVETSFIAYIIAVAMSFAAGIWLGSSMRDKHVQRYRRLLNKTLEFIYASARGNGGVDGPSTPARLYREIMKEINEGSNDRP